MNIVHVRSRIVSRCHARHTFLFEAAQQKILCDNFHDGNKGNIVWYFDCNIAVKQKSMRFSVKTESSMNTQQLAINLQTLNFCFVLDV